LRTQSSLELTPPPLALAVFGQPQQNQQQQPASGGLFGNTGATGGQTSSLFGGGAQPAGQQQQPAQGGGLFGGGGGGLFGQKPATPAPTGGLFGSAPAQPAQAGGGLFGGGAGSTGQPAGGGLFGGGQPQANPVGSSLFGAKPASGGLFGGGGLGGSTTGTTGGGLFGNSLGGGQSNGLQLGGQQQQQQPPQQQSLFGGFGQSQQQPQQQQQPQPLQQSLQASVDQNPYGRNPLFDQTTSVWPLAPPADNTPEKKPPLAGLASRSRALTGSKNLPRLRGFNPSPAAGSPRSASPGLADPSSPGSFVARQSVKKLVLSHKVDSGDMLGASRGSNGGGLGASNSGGLADSQQSQHERSTKLSFDGRGGFDGLFNNDFGPPAGTPAKAQQQQPPLARNPSAASMSGSIGTSVLKKSAARAAAAAAPPPAAPKAPLQHGDYYTKPDIDELVRFGYQDLTALPNFVVGRKGYGEVAFLAPVDLTSVPAIRDIPGGIVLFADKMCEVYPDNVPKAPRGTGLNVPSRITLERCWPVDKATREPIKDVGHPRVKSHLRVLKGMPETDFVSYEAESGTWVFKVAHFSRYGLLGSDEEEDDEEVEAEAIRQKSPVSTATATGGRKRVSLSPSDVSASSSSDGGLLSDGGSPSDTDDDSPAMSVDSFSADELAEDDHDDETTSVEARPPPWGAAAGVEPRKVQVMQASFFGDREGRAADVTPRASRPAASAPVKRSLPFQNSFPADPNFPVSQPYPKPAGGLQVRL